MDQFENGNLQGGSRRSPASRAGGLPSVGLNGGLAAPGVAADIYAGQGRSNAFDALEASLGITNTIANIVGRNRDRAERERDRQATMNDAERRRAEAANEARLRQEEQHLAGAGSLLARTSLPELRSKIERGEIVVPDGVPITDFAEEFIQQSVGDQPEAYRDAYRSQALPNLTDAFVKQQDGFRAKARDDSVVLLREKATVAATGDEIQTAVSTFSELYPDIPETQVLGSIVLPAAKSAAENGDRTRLDAALSVIGDRFPDERMDLERKFQQTVAAAQNDRNDAFRQGVSSLFVEGAPLESIEKHIRTTGASGGIDPTVVDQSLERIDRERKSRDVARLGEIKKTAQVTVFNEAVSNASQVASDRNGLGITTTGEVRVPFADTEIVIKNADVAEEVRKQAWSEIDSRYPESPDARRAAKVEWLSTNVEVKDPELSRLFAGAPSRAHAAIDDDNVPPALVAGLEEFRRLRVLTADGQTLYRHMSSDADAEFFRLADAIQTNTSQTDPAQAIRTAAIISRKKALGGNVGVPDSILKDIAADELDSTNGAYAEQNIRTRAQVYIGAAGLNPEQAIKAATNEFKADHRLFNGFWIPTRGRTAIDGKAENGEIDLDRVAKSVVGSWAKANDADPSLYSIRPDDVTGEWRVVPFGMGTPAPGSPSFSDRDLVAINDSFVDHNASIREMNKALVSSAYKKSVKSQGMREFADIERRATTTPGQAKFYGDLEASSRALSDQILSGLARRTAGVQTPTSPKIPLATGGRRGPTPTPAVQSVLDFIRNSTAVPNVGQNSFVPGPPDTKGF